MDKVLELAMIYVIAQEGFDFSLLNRGSELFRQEDLTRRRLRDGDRRHFTIEMQLVQTDPFWLAKMDWCQLKDQWYGELLPDSRWPSSLKKPRLRR